MLGPCALTGSLAPGQTPGIDLDPMDRWMAMLGAGFRTFPPFLDVAGAQWKLR